MGEGVWFDMFAELSRFQSEGVHLYLGTQGSSPEEISDYICSVREGDYMRDYVTDEKGVISEIRFHKID